MRHVFILNPRAGKRGDALKLAPAIRAWFDAHAGTYDIRITNRPGAATRIAAEACAAGGPVRLYACGGDGTLMEVLNGVPPYAEVEIASVACGSANDYVRLFGGEAFRQVEALIEGRAVPMDVIRCTREETGESLLSLDICAVGMDADVADKMKKYKNWPLVSGSSAYTLAIADVFFHRLGHVLRVEMETEKGRVERKGRFFFALAASGQYYGGGYRGAPEAAPNDGELDFVLVDVVRRPEALRFLKHYRRGTHGSLPYVHMMRGRRMTVTATEPVAVTVDGECFRERRVAFEVLPGACRFVLPAGIEC